MASEQRSLWPYSENAAQPTRGLPPPGRTEIQEPASPGGPSDNLGAALKLNNSVLKTRPATYVSHAHA